MEKLEEKNVIKYDLYTIHDKLLPKSIHYHLIGTILNYDWLKYNQSSSESIYHSKIYGICEDTGNTFLLLRGKLRPHKSIAVFINIGITLDEVSIIAINNDNNLFWVEVESSKLPKGRLQPSDISVMDILS